MTENRPDTPPEDCSAIARARDRHAALIAATMAAVDALPPLDPDAALRSFEALKAREAER
jgi:hypothetical protein